MPLIRGGDGVSDAFVALADEAPAPEGQAIIVGFERYRAEGETLLNRAGRLGVRLKNSDPITALLGDLDRIALIVLEFPKFQDGRAMSQARLLRERHRYAGEIRAVGNLLYDQLAFMRRCGFSAFEIADPAIAARFAEALAAMPLVYQPAADHRETIIERRRRPEAGAPREAPVEGESRGAVKTHALEGDQPRLQAPGAEPGGALAAAEADCAAFWAY